MATLREQVEAYGFETRRQVAALLHGEERSPLDPRRRLNRSLIAGLVVGVLALAGVGVAGLLSGSGSSSVPDNGAVIVAGTGGRYVVIDKVAHPALNLASALLVGGKAPTTVSAEALAALPRGLPIGIPEAPDSLPTQGSLVAGRWTVCSTDPRASSARPVVTVSVGVGLAKALPLGRGVVALDPSGATWLLVDGSRYAVSRPVAALLGLAQVPAIHLQFEVLDLLPEGRPLAVPAVPGSGAAPSVRLPFTAAVGDVVRATGLPNRYVVLSTGLASVDPFAYELLAGQASRNLSVSPAKLAQVPTVAAPDALVPATWPHEAPTLSRPDPGAPLCLSYAPGLDPGSAAWPMQLGLPASAPVPAGARFVAPTSGTLPTVATGVAIAPGHGALVRATATGGVLGVYTLVTDAGIAYPVPTSDAVGRLGLSAPSAERLPLPFLDLLPAGPALDPRAAAAEYAGAAGGSPAPTPSSVVTTGSGG